MTTELVHRVRQGPVCTLTLDSPHNRNALSAPLLDELAEGLAEAAADAVGPGRGPDRYREGLLLGRRPLRPSDDRLLPYARAPRGDTVRPVPVIARVGGHARAGGLGLIATADLAVATAATTYAFSEVRVGVAPAMILVPALRVGDRRFLARAVLTGEPFNAAEAADGGVAHRRGR